MPPAPRKPGKDAFKKQAKLRNRMLGRQRARYTAEQMAQLVNPGPDATVLALQLFQLALRGVFNPTVFRNMNQRYKKR